MKINLICEKGKTNITPKGTIGHTWWAICSEKPKCAECGVIIPDHDNAFFCFACNKLFCWDCVIKDAFVCHKHFKGIKEHTNRIVKIRIEENGDNC